MKKTFRTIFIIILLLGAGFFYVVKNPDAPLSQKIFTILGISTRPQGEITDTTLANPASIYCLDNGGDFEVVDTTGGQVGMCTLKDGTICEERSYMRGECGTDTNPGDGQTACTMEAKLCPDGSAVGRSGPNCEFAACPNEEPTVCTMEYAPVCASVAIQCITTPCDPIEQTFSNRCVMNQNKLATFLHDGECTGR
ncbi:MAG: DUF333 domain-containing protein [Candidatus Absconditabacterales bacterium]